MNRLEMLERRAIQAVREEKAFAFHVTEELLEPIDGGAVIGAAGGAAYAISSRMIGGLERASLNECPFNTICGSEAANVVPAQFLLFPVGRLGDRQMSALGRKRPFFLAPGRGTSSPLHDQTQINLPRTARRT
ncbi:hypothetical protein [Bordetella genomosp. 1]|uniref:hypothetical protein n=1 Tax=Bordetella genomosp. 1 TaxID=1395607 RepID=UPI001177DCCA|nr:hypothetical protein [Bordetella genomosp. 1]